MVHREDLFILFHHLIPLAARSLFLNVPASMSSRQKIERLRKQIFVNTMKADRTIVSGHIISVKLTFSLSKLMFYSCFDWSIWARRAFVMGKGFKKKARDDIEGAARGRPILAKSRLIDALMGKLVPRPKLAEMATRAAIKAWVIDTTETRAANLAERARRAAEQAAAVEAAAATAVQEAVAQAAAAAQAEAEAQAEVEAAAEAARQKRPSNGNRRRSAEAIQRLRASKSAKQKAKKDAAVDRPSAPDFGLTPGLSTSTKAAQQREKLKKGN